MFEVGDRVRIPVADDLIAYKAKQNIKQTLGNHSERSLKMLYWFKLSQENLILVDLNVFNCIQYVFVK